MRRIALTSAAALAVAIPTAASAKSNGLVGEVGPGASIEVKLNGRDLKTIKAGTYSIKIQDKSAAHNFHLKGPGISRRTSVGGTTETTWRITLKPGVYTYQCDPHAAMGMRGTFRVTA
jgi:plastocyanin